MVACDLNHVDADAATGADHDHPVVSPDVGTSRNVDRSGDRIGNYSRCNRIEFVRNRDGVAIGQRDPRGVAAVAVDTDEAFQIAATILMTCSTALAVAAIEVEVCNDSTAHQLGISSIAQLDDASHQLMSGYTRQKMWIVAQVAVDVVENGEAYPAGFDFDEDFTEARRRDGEFLPLGRVSPLPNSEAGLLCH